MNNPARWESDPTGRFRLRYWDGRQWSQHVSNGDGVTLHDPHPVATGIQGETLVTTRAAAATPGDVTGQIGRPRVRLATTGQVAAKASDAQPCIPDARVLSIPAVGQVGEVHSFGVRLRKGAAVVIRHDPMNDHLVIVTERGESRETSGRFRSAAITANPLRTRPGRLWWALKNVAPTYSPEVGDALRAELARLTAIPNDETVAFALEAMPHGLDDAEMLRLGVEEWRIAYERLRSAPGSERMNDRSIRVVLASDSCPRSIRVALAMHTGSPIDQLLRDVPVLAGALVDESGVDTRRSHAVIAQAKEFAEILCDIGATSWQQIETAVNGESSSRDPRFAAVGALSQTPSALVIVDTATPLSLVDDLIDKGFVLELAADWPPEDQRYCTARQDPLRLSDQDVIDLDFTVEAMRRARDGNLATFGHMLSDDERFAVAITALAESGQSLDPEMLETMADHPSAAALAGAVRSGQWGEVPLSLVEAAGVGNLLIRLDPPDREPRSSVEAAIMSRAALRLACDSLFEWKWDIAVQQGQRGMRWSREEQVRDELMNVVAAALWMRGKRSEALQLLRKALEGQYTMPLVCNTAAVAATLDTATAMTELSRLARESPDDVMRLIAAERAFVVWHSSVSEDDDDPEPPAVLLSALRSLLTLDVSDDRYRQILRILAEHDSEWMAAQSPAAFGRRGASPEARVYRARAKGLSEFIAELASVHQVKPRPEWVEQEALRLGGFLIEYLAENLGDQSSSAGVSIAMDVLATNLPLPAEVHIRLVTLVSASVRNLIEDGEPKDEFIDWFLAAKRRVNEVSGADKAELERLLNISGNQLATSYLVFREGQVGQLIDIFNDLVTKAQALGRVGQLNESEFKKAMRSIATDAGGHAATVMRALTVVSDKDLRTAAQELLTTANELQSNARSLG